MPSINISAADSLPVPPRPNQNFFNHENNANPVPNPGPSPGPSGPSSTSNDVRVIVRLRPPSQSEEQVCFFKSLHDDKSLCWRIDPYGVSSLCEEVQFDGVIDYGENISDQNQNNNQNTVSISNPNTNAQLYNDQLQFSKSIEGAINGYPETIFAYGQTGAGKSYTIIGSESSPGILPRCTRDLFQKLMNLGEIEQMQSQNKLNQQIQQQSQNSDGSGPGPKKIFVSLTACEVKDSNVVDLLPSEKVLEELQQSQQSKTSTSSSYNSNANVPPITHERVSVRGKTLTYKRVSVTSYPQVMELLRHAVASREVGCSSLNAESSRSHMIIRFYIKNIEKGTQGSVTLVDLAGSEKVNEGGSVSSTSDNTMDMNKFNNDNNSNGNSNFNHGINSTLGNSNSSNNLNRRGEATGINVSLTHLNRLLVKMQGPVNRLDESDRRQSTLNMILYDSLKDDCGVTMIFCIHPDRMTYQASKTTVLMALRCKRIQRKKKIRNVGYDETINQQNEKLLSLQQVQRQQKEQQMQLEQQQQKYQQQQANMQMQQAQQQQQQSFQQQQQMYQFNQQQQMGSQQNGPINFHMNQYNQNQMMTPGQIMSQNQMYQFGQPQPVPNNNNINMDANMMGLITPGHLNQQQQYSTMSNSNFTPQHSNLSNLQQQQMYYQQQQNQLNFCSDQLQRHASQSSIPSTCNQNLQNFQNNQNQQNQMNGPIQNMQQQFQQGPTPDFDVQSQVSGVPSQYSQCYSQSYQGHNGRYRQRERDEDRALIESLERKNVCLQEMVSELQQLRQVQVSSNNNIGVGAINDINDRHNQFLKENFGTESTVLDSAQKKVDSTSQNQSEQSQQTTELEREVQQLRKTLLAHGLPLPNSNKSSQSLTTQQLSKTASVTNPESNSNSTQEPMVSNTNESHSGSDETSTEVNDNTSVSASQSGNLNLTNMTNFSDVVSLMSKRPQSEAVHIQGLKAVLNLFSNASLKQGIDEVQQGGQQNQQLIPFPSPHQASSILDTTLHALRSFPKVRRIQRDGALILSNLIQKNLNMPDLRKTIAHKIIKEGLVLDNLNSEESANLTNQQLSNSGVGTNGNSSKDCLVKDLHVAICRLVAVLVQRNPDLQNMIGQVAVEKILKILDVRKSMVLEQVLRQQQFKVLNGQSLEDNHNHPASNSDSSDVSSLLPDDLTIHACWSLMNLCNKCASNQNLVRNFDGIDILLTLLDAQVKGTPKSDSKGNITNSNTENQNQNQINLTLAPYNNNNINPDESFNTVVSDSASGPGTHQTETLRQSLSPSKLNVCAYMSGCIASLVELSPPNQCALVQLYGIENLISVLSIQGVMKGAPAIVSNICIALAHASNNDIQSGAVERIQNFGFRILVEALCMYVDHTPVAGNICRCIAALTPLNGESSDKQSSDKQKFNLAKKAQIQFLEMQIIAIEEKQQQASNMSKSDDAGCPNDTTENGTATQQDSSTSQTQTKLSFRLKSSESVTTAVTSTNGSQSHSNIHSLPQLLVHLLRIHGMKDCSFSTTVCWALGNLVGFRSSAMRLAVAELEMIVQLLEKYGEEAIENCKKLNLSESEKGSVNNSSTVTVVSHNNTNNLILPLRFCEYCCRLISELTRTSVQNQAYEDLNGDSEVASENRLILKNRTSLVQTLTKLRGYFMQNVNNNGGQNGNNNASSQSHILMGRIKELYHNLLQ